MSPILEISVDQLLNITDPMMLSRVGSKAKADTIIQLQDILIMNTNLDSHGRTLIMDRIHAIKKEESK